MSDSDLESSSGDEEVGKPTFTLPDGVDINQVESAVKALIKYAAKSKSDGLFLDAPTRILMEIGAFKTPIGKHHFYHITLPYTPHKEFSDLEILLVVPDVKNRDPDHVVGDVKDVLLNSEENIKVREVMTFKQFRDDYSTYEAKRALEKSVDVVIAEKKIWKQIPAVLGKGFMKKKKFPIAIPGRSMKSRELGKQIWFALHKTVLNLSLTGVTSTLVVGHDSLTEEELTNNISKIISWLAKSFPGGWANVKSLSLNIGERNMPPLTIYFSPESRNDVKKRPQTKGTNVEQPIEDEISTRPGKRIKVHATGEITVKDAEDRDPLDDILN